ncbi:MAG: NEW3 domain-containing protein, partial [Gemmatimonadaceae bacterium]
MTRLAIRGLLAMLLGVGAPAGLGAHGRAADVLRLPPVTIAGAPRSLVTFAIAVPAEVEAAAGLRYQVELRGATEVLGRLEGELAEGRRQIVLTLRVPADARVGLLDVADVIFRGADGEVVIVPIILRVPAVRAMRITGPPMYADLRQGDRVEIAFRIQNLGNAPEEVEVHVTPPSGWLMRTPRVTVVRMEPFGSRDVNVRLSVPAAADGGDYYVAGSVRPRSGADSAVAVSASTRLQVRARETREPGLKFSPFVAAATSYGGTAVATGFGLHGPIADNVRLSLQVLPFASSTNSGGLGLAGVGGIGVPVQAAVFGDGWNVIAGNTSARISDLTGMNVVGVGAQASLNRSGREAIVLASRPISGTGQTGEHLGAGAWWNTAFGRVGGSASQLRESYNGAISRELTAVGADWTSHPVKDWVLDGGLAVRQVNDAAHLGYRVQALREGDGQRVRGGGGGGGRGGGGGGGGG